MSTVEKCVLIALTLINLTAFGLFCLDKYYAKKKMLRIPEIWLLTSCGLFGALGGLLGMVLLRHKTNYQRHRIFVLGVPLAFVLQMLLLFFLFK